MSIFGKLIGGLLGLPWGPVGLVVGLILGHLADLSWEGRGRTGAFGPATPALAARLADLWGRLSGHGGTPNRSQLLFLQALLVQSLGLRSAEAQAASETYLHSFRLSASGDWRSRLDSVAWAARDLREDYLLDDRTLVWVYATARRLAALGEVRAGLVELLDTLAQGFGIFDQVGTAGTEGRAEGAYEQAWKNFRPSSQAGAEAFAALGLKAEATNDEIKKAYRTLARQYHPDAQSHLAEGDPGRKAAAEKFLQVQQAYDRLKDLRGL